jgi:hypothetical protein
MWGFQVSRQLRFLPGLCRCSREVDTPKMEGTMMTCPWLLHLWPPLIGGSTAKRGSQTSLCGLAVPGSCSPNWITNQSSCLAHRPCCVSESDSLSILVAALFANLWPLF